MAKEEQMDDIGDHIFRFRKRMKLSQEAFGRRFDISSPAVFKFEHKHLFPSLDLWKKMAQDMGMNPDIAVCIWLWTRLPEEHKHLVNLEGGISRPVNEDKSNIPDYSKIQDDDALRTILLQSKEIPQGLQELIQDDNFWIVF